MKVYVVFKFCVDNYYKEETGWDHRTDDVKKIFNSEEKAKQYIIDEIELKDKDYISLDTIPTVDEIQEGLDIVYDGDDDTAECCGYYYFCYEVE